VNGVSVRMSVVWGWLMRMHVVVSEADVGGAAVSCLVLS